MSWWERKVYECWGDDVPYWSILLTRVTILLAISWVIIQFHDCV